MLLTMPSISSLLIAALAITGVSARAVSTELSRRQPPGSGSSGGFYYHFWTDTYGTVNAVSGPGGDYSVSWTTQAYGNFVVGKGWNPGTPRTIKYSGTFQADLLFNSSYSYLGVYGMVRGNPFVEFFIVDTARGYDEGLPGYTLRGTVNSDGAIYDVYHVRQFTGGFAPAFIDRIWSIRRSTYAPGPVSGTITTSNHFDAWRSFGLPFGTIEQLVVAVEGYRSAGSAAITVKP